MPVSLRTSFLYSAMISFSALGLKLVIELHLLALLDAVEDVLELLLGNIQHHVAEHLDQAAIGVIRKAGIAAALGQRFDGLVVEAEVQNRVHHAGHRELRARADGNQQRILAGAELLPLQLFQPVKRCVHFGIDLRADLSAHVFAAGLGLNGESRRHRQSGVGHLGQACALAAQNILHAAVAVRFAVTEEVHILGWG